MLSLTHSDGAPLPDAPTPGSLTVPRPWRARGPAAVLAPGRIRAPFALACLLGAVSLGATPSAQSTTAGGGGSLGSQFAFLNEGSTVVLAEVWDVDSGAPLEGIDVLVPEYGIRRRTDAEGFVRFREAAFPPGADLESELRLAVLAEGYAPRVVTFDPSPEGRAFDRRLIPVRSLESYSSPLTGAGAALTWSLATTVAGGGEDVPYTFELEVPAGTIGVDYRVRMCPVPMFLRNLEGIDLETPWLGEFSIEFVDASDAKIDTSRLPQPVTVRVSQALAVEVDEEDWRGAESELSIWRFDEGALGLVRQAAPVRITDAGLFECETTSFSTFTLVADALWPVLGPRKKQPGPLGGTTPPDPGLDDIDVGVEVECVFGGSAPISCGQMSAPLTNKIDRGAQLTLSTELGRQLRARFGASTKGLTAMVVGKLDAALQGQVSLTASGSVSTTMSREMGGSVGIGDIAHPNACLSGQLLSNVVNEVAEVQVLGFQVLTLEVPIGIEFLLKGMKGDTSCPKCKHERHVDLPDSESQCDS